jgi:hypothetical protein
MHSVLHDWPDKICVKIVQRIKDAMKPGYRKLLINENVITATGASWEATATRPSHVVSIQLKGTH